MGNRASWVWTVYDQVYVWPHGDAVHVYDSGAWARRLVGEVRDAQPHSFVHVRGFADEQRYREWVREYDRALRDARTRANVALIQGRPLLVD